MGRALTVITKAPGQEEPSVTRLNHGLQRLRAASAPLLQNLDPETRVAVSGDGSA
jgi:hypothetical protein